MYCNILFLECNPISPEFLSERRNLFASRSEKKHIPAGGVFCRVAGCPVSSAALLSLSAGGAAGLRGGAHGGLPPETAGSTVCVLRHRRQHGLLLSCHAGAHSLRLRPAGAAKGGGGAADLEDTAKSGIGLLQSWLLELASHTPQSVQPLLSENVTSFFSNGTSLLDKVIRYILGLAGNILSHIPDGALSLGTAVISSFLISARLPKIKSWLKKRLPEEKLKPAADALKRMKNAVGGWLTAQLKLMGVTFTILTLGFVVLRIAYAPLWALVVALVDALPVLGTGTVLVPWAVICFLQGEGARAIGLLGVYAVVTLSRSMLEPKLVGRHLGLDPLVTLMALYVGYKLWGVGGMIFAPLLAVTIMQVTPGRERGDTPEIP